MTLGENIVRLRTQKNWSQGDLADTLDISRQSVSKWETDASIPELDKLLKLSELFGVTLDELVRGEDAPKAETAAPAAQAVPASFMPQTSSEQEKRHTIAGTILLCIGAVLLLTCLILAGDLAEQHAHIYGLHVHRQRAGGRLGRLHQILRQLFQPLALPVQHRNVLLGGGGGAAW